MVYDVPMTEDTNKTAAQLLLFSRLAPGQIIRLAVPSIGVAVVARVCERTDSMVAVRAPGSWAAIEIFEDDVSTQAARIELLQS